MEVKALKKPPAGVRLTLKAICIMFQASWGSHFPSAFWGRREEGEEKVVVGSQGGDAVGGGGALQGEEGGGGDGGRGG